MNKMNRVNDKMILKISDTFHEAAMLYYHGSINEEVDNTRVTNYNLEKGRLNYYESLLQVINYFLDIDDINSSYLEEETIEKITTLFKELDQAIEENGLNSEETCLLTEAMLNSGKTIDLSSIPGVKVDKHSTGGVGDKTTLIVAPIVASCDVPVAKMSGRSLGYTGGTIDKLESIPGYKVNIPIDDFIKQVSEIKVCISTTTENLAPADKKIYALRDVTGTVSSKSLIAASIMSKKLATGADKILLDVKYGKGALVNTKEEAVELARLMVYIGNKHGKETKALVTNMNYPLGSMIGNSLELKEVIQILNGRGNKDLRDLCVVLSSYMISMSKNIDFISAQGEVLEAIRTGKAYRKFLEFITYQGGDLRYVKISNNVVEVKSTKEGYLNDVDALEIAKCALKLGAGRTYKDELIDHSVGIEIIKNIGEYINVGDTLARAYVGDKTIDFNEIASAFKISLIKEDKEPLIYGTIK